MPPASPTLKYRRLKQTHPEYDGGYWREIRALYEGGKRLLRDPTLIEQLFPRQPGETAESYGARKAVIFYVSHLGTIIDFIVAGLATDPARLVPPADESAKEGERPTLEEFYAEFEKDCSPVGGEKQPFAELLRDVARTGLLLGRWWTLVDLPKAPADAPAPRTEKEQIDAGLLEGYAVEIAPECVLDWERDEVSGELLWANVRTRHCRRADMTSARDVIRDEYRYYTRDAWALYVVEYSKDKSVPSAKLEPDDDKDIAPTTEGTHTMGRVPVIPGALPVGLWAGNKLHSLAVEYLQKSNALSWAQTRALFPILYEFLGSELPGTDTPISEAQTNPKRADARPKGVGIAQIRGQDDDAKYVAPPTEAFVHASTSLKELREDMYRVTYQMALAEDNTGAVIKRSADSKKLDHTSTNVVLGKVGTHVRNHGDIVVNTVAIGRKDDDGYTTAGMEKFDVAELAEQIEQAIAIETVSIPSATYQKKRKLRLVRTDLGDEATPEVMKEVEKELAGAITQDALEMAPVDPLDDEDVPPPDDADGKKKPTVPAKKPPAKKHPAGAPK